VPEDERARYRAGHHQQRRRLPSPLIGALILIVAIVGPYIAFSKHVPFTGRGYELTATFRNAVSISPKSPVRIAGVDVGEVVGTSSAGRNTTVQFTVNDDGQPITSDAMVKIRPRIFLEGNYFLDVDPGSPSAPELASGSTIPITHTATAVQFDEILTALQAPQRQQLGRVLEGYGTALTHKPTAAEDVTQDPQVQGLSAAEALNRSFDYGGKAGRAGSQVAEALLGTEPDDLSRLIAGSAKTFAALSVHEQQLRDLVSNWNRFTGALAAESDNLGRTLQDLPSTLQATRSSLANLSRTLPIVRRWALELQPSLAELPGTIDAANPWLAQAQPLLSKQEAGGLIELVRRATPDLAGASQAGLTTLPQIGQLSRCTSSVLVPTGNQVIDDRFSTGQPNYREFFYTTVSLAGESQSFDGNGAYLRLQPEAGDLTASETDPNGNLATDKTLWAHTTLPPLGTQPGFGPKPPYRPDVKCYENDVPDLNAGLGAVGPPSPAPAELPPQ
jgi:ABC-type transporter Mla subunit MlaD